MNLLLAIKLLGEATRLLGRYVILTSTMTSPEAILLNEDVTAWSNRITEFTDALKETVQ